MMKKITFTVVELCQRVEISEDELVEIVGLGVIVPLEPAQPSWEFDYPALSHLQRAQAAGRAGSGLAGDRHGADAARPG